MLGKLSDRLKVNLAIYCIQYYKSYMILQWRHNERGGVQNHQRLHCLLNCWIQAQIK